MKKTLLFACFLTTLTNGQIVNPLVSFNNKSSEQPPPAVLKWTADINGDGHPEIFISRKDEYDEDKISNLLPGWFVYLSKMAPNSFEECEGVADEKTHEISHVAPMIDILKCYIGHVEEAGKIAIVTQQVDNPRIGEPIAYIYAYTVEGNHLKRTKLAEYNPKEENAIYNKYLKEDKRTTITLSEVAP